MLSEKSDGSELDCELVSLILSGGSLRHVQAIRHATCPPLCRTLWGGDGVRSLIHRNGLSLKIPANAQQDTNSLCNSLFLSCMATTARFVALP